jgi:hypothetical protein
MFRQELHQYQEEKGMPYITSVERLALEEGLLRGIEVCLKVKFGPDGLKLLPEIRQLEDVQMLRTVLDAIETASTPEELRRVWAP